MRMRELMVFADVALDSFMAEPDNELDFMVGEEELEQALMRGLMPRADRIPPSIQEHLGDSRTRVAVGCAGWVP
jgi:hypothetical protein